METTGSMTVADYPDTKSSLASVSFRVVSVFSGFMTESLYQKDHPRLGTVFYQRHSTLDHR